MPAKNLHWKTPEVMKLLEGLDARMEVEGQGGDVDTETIRLTPKAGGDSVCVCGFSTNWDITSPADTKIEMVEVNDHQDSRGGLNSDNEDTCVLYGKIVARLRKAGYSVVPRLKDYF